MRENLIGEVQLNGSEQGMLTCRYYILIRTISDPIACESYGIRIMVQQTQEVAEILDITVQPSRIEELVKRLVAGGVTPCTLRDVVDDWL